MDMDHPPSAGPSHTPIYPCFWNYCPHTFPSRPSLRVHFEAHHAPDLLPELVPGQRLRRHPQGGWERVGEAVSLSHNLPIPPFSQTTGDITTTTTTDTTFPLPSFGSLPPPPSFPSFDAFSQSQPSQPLLSPTHHQHLHHIVHEHEHEHQQQHRHRHRHHDHHHDHHHHQPHEHHPSYSSASASASHLSQEILSHPIAMEVETPYPAAIATAAILPLPKLSEPLSRFSSISPSPSRSPSSSPYLHSQPPLSSHLLHTVHSVDAVEVPMPPPKTSRSVRSEAHAAQAAQAVQARVQQREGVAAHAADMDVDVVMSFGSVPAPYAGPSQVGLGLGRESGSFGSFSTPEHISPYVPVTQAIPSPFPSSPSFVMPSRGASHSSSASPSALPLANPGNTSSSRIDAAANGTASSNDHDHVDANTNNGTSAHVGASASVNTPASPAPSSVEAPRSRAPSLSHSLPLRFGAALDDVPVLGSHTTTTTPGRASASATASAPVPRNGNAVGIAFGFGGISSSGEARRGRFPVEGQPGTPETQTQSQAQAQTFSSRARKVSNAERVGFSWGMGQ